MGNTRKIVALAGVSSSLSAAYQAACDGWFPLIDIIAPYPIGH